LKLTLKSGPQTVNIYLRAIDSFFNFVGLGEANNLSLMRKLFSCQTEPQGYLLTQSII